MITRTFLDKTTTIKQDCTYNYGLHPICALGYGNGVCRSLIHFDLSKVSELINDKTYANVEKLTHRLQMKNCGAVDSLGFFNKANDYMGLRQRATSFDVVLFKVNKHWDEGVGFDNINDFWAVGKGATSQYGATWYNATTSELWDDAGIYSTELISNEIDAYLSGATDTIIVGLQHFDHGNENLDIDITDYVNSIVLDGEENYGLCLAFIPELEEMGTTEMQYVGFFNNKTNTIFEPVVETRYHEEISDDRMNFYLGKDNKLYLYSYIGGKLENLDELPECIIDETEYIVTQESKGVYSINIRLTNKDYTKDTIVYDVWRNLKYHGNDIDDVELEFVTKASTNFFSVSNEVFKPKALNPIITGIDANEKVNRGEERVIKLYFRQPYTKSDFELVDNCEYRIYAKDGEREVTIVDWDSINKMDRFNVFMIKTDELVPADYHVDIKAHFGDNVRIFKDELNFTVVSDVKEIKL